MDEVSFQLPVASMDILVRIILGYYHAGASNDPVSVLSVAESTAMKRPNISGNNKFLQSVNILEKTGKGFQFTSIGSHLAQQLDYDQEAKNQDTKAAWSSIVDGNDFLSRMTSAVKIRGNMDSEAFARHIALTSGAPNKPQFMRGARTIIAILKSANKIIEGEDGTLKTIGKESPLPDGESAKPDTTIQSSEKVVTPELPLQQFHTSKHMFSIMVQLSPETTDEDLEEMARKIKYFSKLLDGGEITGEDDVDIS